MNSTRFLEHERLSNGDITDEVKEVYTSQERREPIRPEVNETKVITDFMRVQQAKICRLELELSIQNSRAKK